MQKGCVQLVQLEQLVFLIYISNYNNVLIGKGLLLRNALLYLLQCKSNVLFRVV